MQARFRQLHGNCLQQLVSEPLQASDQRLHDPVIQLIATHMPYYLAPPAVLHGLLSLPPLSHAAGQQENVPDFMVKAFSNKLAQIPSVAGLV